MSFPLEITFRHMEPSPALEQHVRAEWTKLQELSEDIRHCHVIVDAPHLHCQRGHEYHISLFLRMPDQDIIVNYAPWPPSTIAQESVEQIWKHLEPKPSHKDAYAAVDCVFTTARHKLQEYNDQSRMRHRQAAQALETL